MVMPLPRVGKGQRITVLARPGLRDPNTTSMDEAMRAVLMTLDVLQDEDESLGILGFQLLLDANGLTFSHAAQITPLIIKKFSTILQVTRLLLVVSKSFILPRSAVPSILIHKNRSDKAYPFGRLNWIDGIVCLGIISVLVYLRKRIILVTMR